MRSVQAIGTIDADGENITLPDGVTKAHVHVSGTWTGTIEVQIANSAGTYVTEQDKGTLTANGIYVFEGGGLPVKVRALSTAWTSGSAVVEIAGLAS
jgi:hypothetical protein